MRRIKEFVFLLFCICNFTACSTNPTLELDREDGYEDGQTENNEEDSSSGVTGEYIDFDVTWEDVINSSYIETSEVIVTDKSHDEYDDFVENSTFSTTVKINFTENNVTVIDAPSGVIVSNDGAHLIVNSSLSGIAYELTGSTQNGSIKMYSDKKFKLTLAGISLASNCGAAINIQSSKRVFVEVADGTTNSLADASSYTFTDGEDQKGCFFSEAQLLFSGSGTLNVTSNYAHAICSDDYIYFRSGTNLTIPSAVKDGIHANDKIVIGGGKITINSSGDGIDCEKGHIDIRSGEIIIAAADDAITASYEDGDASIVPYIQISNGMLQLTTTDKKGVGLKSTGNVTISGGIIKAAVAGAASKGIKVDGDLSLSGGKIILLTTGDAMYESDDISSPAGINCDGSFTVNDVELYIKSTGSAGKGISIDGTINITNSTVKVITTGKQFVYNRLDSSAKGIKAEGNLTINSGTIWVKATGGEGSEGIESKNMMTINGGSIAVYTYDDCLNASKSIVINGGDIYCYSSGNDGIDSNGTFTVTGGTIVSVGSTSPEGGIDCDNSTFKITGGTIVSVGGSTSNPTSSVCTQNSLIYSGTSSSSTLLTIQSSNNEHVMSFKVPRTYSRLVMLFSSSKLIANNSYSIYSGGAATSGTSFNGLVTNASYSGGSQLYSFTTSSMVTSLGSSSSGGNRP